MIWSDRRDNTANNTPLSWRIESTDTADLNTITLRDRKVSESMLKISAVRPFSSVNSFASDPCRKALISISTSAYHQKPNSSFTLMKIFAESWYIWLRWRTLLAEFRRVIWANIERRLLKSQLFEDSARKPEDSIRQT